MEVDEKFAQAAECKIDPAIPFPPPILVLPDRKQTNLWVPVGFIGSIAVWAWRSCALATLTLFLTLLLTFTLTLTLTL